MKTLLLLLTLCFAQTTFASDFCKEHFPDGWDGQDGQLLTLGLENKTINYRFAPNLKSYRRPYGDDHMIERIEALEVPPQYPEPVGDYCSMSVRSQGQYLKNEHFTPDRRYSFALESITLDSVKACVFQRTSDPQRPDAFMVFIIAEDIDYGYRFMVDWPPRESERYRSGVVGAHPDHYGLGKIIICNLPQSKVNKKHILKRILKNASVSKRD